MLYFSAMVLCPNAFFYAPIILPFALGNGVTAGSLYVLLEKSLGGPRAVAGMGGDAFNASKVMPWAGVPHSPQGVQLVRCRQTKAAILPGVKICLDVWRKCLGPLLGRGRPTYEGGPTAVSLFDVFPRPRDL